MKTFASLAAGVLLSFWVAAQAAETAKTNWLTDLPEALAKAKTDHKTVLVNFTGSDWCHWCIKLKNEVFSKPEFIAYAEKNLILVELDFPNNKPNAKELKKKNQPLADKYGIEGFPTVLAMNGEGKVIDRLGYMPGGPKAFLDKLESVQKKAGK